MVTDRPLGADHPAQLIRNANELLLDVSRQVGLAYIDAYEANLGAIAQLQDRWADTALVDWMGELGHAQADFTREVARIIAGAGRRLLR